MESRFGPLVPRAVRHGAALIIAAAVVFVVGGVVGVLVPNASYWAAPYRSLTTALAPSGLSINALLLVFGVLEAVGILLVWGGFRARPTRLLGLLLLVVNGALAVALGAMPYGSAHTIANAVPSLSRAFFITGGLGLIVLTLAMLRDARWGGLREYTLASGLVTLAAGLVYWQYGSLGPMTGQELVTLAVAPLVLWLVVAGANLIRFPTYSPPPSLKS